MVAVSHQSLAGANYSFFLIERHKTVLLTAHADGFTSPAVALAWRNARRIVPAVASRHVCGCCSFAPGGKSRDQIVFLAGRGKDLPSRESTTSALVD
jgi:hypothetical protein